MFQTSIRWTCKKSNLISIRGLLASAGENSTLTIKETREKLKDLVGAQRLWGSSSSETDSKTTAPIATSQDDLPVTPMSDCDYGTLVIEYSKEKLKDLVGAQRLWGSSSSEADSKTTAPIATSQDDLPIRAMKDSYREAIIPLGSNPKQREKYINFYNGIRFGRILEDLDTFAVAIGYTHTLSPSSTTQISPISIVTALVDRICLLDERISPHHDVKMTGKVSWAGKTSMEITMHLDQEEDNVWRKLLTAKFVMVARNPKTKGSAIINRLQPEGSEEQQLFAEGEESKAKRLVEGQRTLLKTPPSEDERLLIHNLFLQTIDPKANTFRLRVKPENSVWMEDTILKNLVICMPEQRNMYNKIFGGFLMRKAFELAWANAALFCKTRPYIEIVDDIVFRKPVEVGSLLFLSSQVVFCVGTKLQVKVHAEVVNPKDDTRETTNDFHFTFNTRDADVKTVIPKTYAEAMLYLDGKRHFDS